MSDNEITEMWREHKKASQEKKALNQTYSTGVLEAMGIEFESKNWGNHLVVTGKDCMIDFWPSTGKFIVRGGKSGRGIKNLLKLCDSGCLQG